MLLTNITLSSGMTINKNAPTGEPELTLIGCLDAIKSVEFPTVIPKLVSTVLCELEDGERGEFSARLEARFLVNDMVVGGSHHDFEWLQEYRRARLFGFLVDPVEISEPGELVVEFTLLKTGVQGDAGFKGGRAFPVEYKNNPYVYKGPDAF